MMLISYALLLSLLFTQGLPAVAYPDSHQYFDTPPIEPAYIGFTHGALVAHGFVGETLIRVNPLAPEKIWREFHTDGLDYTLRFVSEPGALMIQYGLVNRDDSGRVIGEISVVWQEGRILGGAFNPPVSGYWCKMRSDLLDVSGVTIILCNFLIGTSHTLYRTRHQTHSATL